MINKETYKRLTERRGALVIDNCGNCPNVRNPQGCVDKNCYEIMRDRLAELEDKIMDGTLVELPCKVGDTATAIVDTLIYDNSIEKVKIEGLAYIVKDENGDTTFQHISRVFHNEEQAETTLKELQENKEC